MYEYKLVFISVSCRYLYCSLPKVDSIHGYALYPDVISLILGQDLWQIGLLYQFVTFPNNSPTGNCADESFPFAFTSSNMNLIVSPG